MKHAHRPPRFTLPRAPRAVLTLGPLLGALMLAAACAPLQTYYKPGQSVERLNRDTTACQVKALKDVPASTQVRRTPPEYVPPRRICDSANNCRTIAGYWLPGEIITYDPNEALRLRVERQCMADRGYAPVSIPACPEGVARAAPQGPTTVLPALNDASCVVRRKDGSFRIVNRG